MGFFSIIETFFFISLGVTIILVALLVYHFKQRLSLVEQKYESLFDIVTSVVKQLSNIQSSVVSHTQNMGQYGGMYQQWPVSENLGNVNISFENPNQMSNTVGMHDVYSVIEPIPAISLNGKEYSNNDEETTTDDSNDSENSDDSDDDDDSEDDDDDFDDSEYDSDSDSSDETSVNSNSVNKHTTVDSTFSQSYEHETTEINRELSSVQQNVTDISKIVVSDDETAQVSGDGVKIINLNVSENEIVNEDIDIAPVNTDEYNADIYDVYEYPSSEIQIDHSLTGIQEESPIVVKKVENIQNKQSETPFFIERVSAKELYKKMTLSNLKATVISKGLCSDPSKLKKHELLKLLEDE